MSQRMEMLVLPNFCCFATATQPPGSTRVHKGEVAKTGYLKKNHAKLNVRGWKCWSSPMFATATPPTGSTSHVIVDSFRRPIQLEICIYGRALKVQQKFCKSTWNVSQSKEYNDYTNDLYRRLESYIPSRHHRLWLYHIGAKYLR